MLELFRLETETQTAALVAGLLELEREPAAAKTLEVLMRAAHSLKGAAQIVRLPVISRLAHAMEDCFVAAQRGKIRLERQHTDVLLRGVDFFARIAKTPETSLASWETDNAVAVEGFRTQLAAMMGGESPVPVPATTPRTSPAPVVSQSSPAVRPEPATDMMRLATETVNRLLGLAGESLVESRRLQPFTQSMQRLKRLHSELSTTLDGLRDTLGEYKLSERASAQVSGLSEKVAACRAFLADRIDELDTFDRRGARLSSRLYQETLQARMRPFDDGVQRFPRMVRDLARSLNKEVRLEIAGGNTQVDREVLEKLDAPLTHLLRNALDHGCEVSGERQRQGKPAEGVVKLEARHTAGMLLVTVADDGQGINLEKLRGTLVQRNLVAAEVAEQLSEAELLEFLFLPGFSTKEDVTEISGRGVGLDVVREMVVAVRGKIHVSTQAGRGTTFQMQLPLSLAVLRVLLIEVSGEPYALPLGQIVQVVNVPVNRMQVAGDRRHFTYANEQVPVVGAHQILERPNPQTANAEISVVVLGDRGRRFGLVVDDCIGERELVLQPLDARLGKIADISAAAIQEDGTPVLILDVEDLTRSVEKIIGGGQGHSAAPEPGRKVRRASRILVVDDSITVRELQRKILSERGYQVEVAVDGMDGWNAVRAGDFDLVISDVDMPRMNGLELVALIKRDSRLKSLPVIIVSHKDREEDRRRGMEAGADEYITKSGFQDEKLLQTVRKMLLSRKNDNV